MSAPTPKPTYLKVFPEILPDALIQLPQWCCWRAVWRPGKGDRSGKWTKAPHQPDGQFAKSTVPATWGEFGECLLAYQSGGFDGIGFVFTAEAGIVGIDLDKCVAEDGTIDEWALEAVRRFNSYTELSPSGTGLHIYARGHIPISGRKKGHVEIYRQGRFFTVTGHLLEEVRL